MFCDEKTGCEILNLARLGALAVELRTIRDIIHGNIVNGDNQLSNSVCSDLEQRPDVLDAEFATLRMACDVDMRQCAEANCIYFDEYALAQDLDSVLVRLTDYLAYDASQDSDVRAIEAKYQHTINALSEKRSAVSPSSDFEGDVISRYCL